MPNNQIDALFDERGIVVRDFAIKNDIPEQTLYKIRKKDTMKNITIDVFLKIAHGLGMTAEELYYGKPLQRTYIDPRQQKINDLYEELNERGQRQAEDSLENVYSNEKNRKSEELEAASAERRTA